MWNFLKRILGRKPEDNVVKCPFCSRRGPLKEFMNWTKNGVSGFRGRLQNGEMVVACPECMVELKYDPSSRVMVIFKL